MERVTRIQKAYKTNYESRVNKLHLFFPSAVFSTDHTDPLNKAAVTKRRKMKTLVPFYPNSWKSSHLFTFQKKLRFLHQEALSNYKLNANKATHRNSQNGFYNKQPVQVLNKRLEVNWTKSDLLKKTSGSTLPTIFSGPWQVQVSSGTGLESLSHLLAQVQPWHSYLWRFSPDFLQLLHSQ